MKNDQKTREQTSLRVHVNYVVVCNEKPMKTHVVAYLILILRNR